MPTTFQLGGLIGIEDPVVSGVFPTLSDFDVERMLAHEYVTHKFSLKKEQRILTRKGGNSWRVELKALQQAPLATLYSFYDTHRQPHQLFYFYDPYEAGGAIDLTGVSTTGRYICRFRDNDLDFNALLDRVFSGSLELIEVNASASVQSIGATLDFDITTSRYPRDTSGGGFVTAFWSKADLTGTMDIVPLVVIMPKRAGQATFIRVSDRLCNIDNTTIGGPTEFHGDYVPRLLSWECSQQIGEGDRGSFVMDNADQVWDAYAQQMDLGRAIISLNIQSATQFGGQYTLKLWRGYIVDWNSDRTAGTFTIECEGGIHALNQKLPRRTATTTCPLEFNFGTQCPYATQGSGGDPDECDKGLDTANGCTAHGMTNYFQGVVVKPVTATGLLPRNSESVWSWGRKAYSTTSTPLKSIQDTVIPLVYGDGRQIVEGKIFEFRDESEFKVASAIVSDGPIGEIGQVFLDGMAHHFVPGTANPGVRALGTVPQDIGTIIDPTFRSSALSFVSMRVNDEVGLDSAADNHTMRVEVLRGLQCLHVWQWTGALDNQAFVTTSNPVIIAHDLLARAVGLSPYAPDNIQLSRYYRIDIFRYTAAVDYCETVVDKLGSAGTEKRFEFRGVISEQKPAIEHIRDVAGNAPIDIVYTYGNVSFKVRKDDITTPPANQVTFEHRQNIIQGSFWARRWEPAFNELKLVFADQEADFQENSVTLYDETAQKRIGFYGGLNELNPDPQKRPLVKQRQINLTGCFSRSQAVRLGTQLLYEELGGATEAEQLDARVVELEAALIGLAVEISDVSRIVHPDLPGGQAYVRWESWSFSNEWKVKLRGRTVTASMYSLTGTGAPPQIPTANPGEVMDFPILEALFPPVLTLISIDYRTGHVGVGCEPALVPAPQFEPPPWIPPPNATPPPPDTIPPTAPASLGGSPASTQASLSWTASTDDVGVTAYSVERCTGAACTGFAEVGTPTGTSFNDTGLTAETVYNYRVRARDAFGNFSEYSNVIEVTTLETPPADTTPPTAPTNFTATPM